MYVVVTRKRLRKMILPNVEAAFDEHGSEDTNLAFGLKMPIHVEKKQIYKHIRSFTRKLYGNHQICRVPAKTEVVAGIRVDLPLKVLAWLKGPILHNKSSYFNA